MSKQLKTRFPLFNRVAVVICSVLILVSVTWTFASAESRAEQTLVTALLAVVFGGLACWALWLTLAWRARPSRGLDELDAVNLPMVSDNALKYRYFTGTKSGAVIIDTHGETIYFVNCFLPRRFLAVSEREHSSPLSGIRAVHRFCDRGCVWLIIITSAGKAVVPNTGEGFEELWRLLKEIVPENAPGFATDDPRTQFAWVLGAICGLFGGWYLTPDQSGDTTLGLFLLGGAILGVVGGHQLIKIIDHWFRVNVARAVGYGILGAIAGPGIGINRLLIAGWPKYLVILAALGGFILGAGLSRIGAVRER